MAHRTALSVQWSFGDAFDALLSHPYLLPSYHLARPDIEIVFYRLQKMYMSELASRTETTIPRRPLAFIPTVNAFSDDEKKHHMDLDHFFTLLDLIEMNEPNYRMNKQIMEIVNREFPRTRKVLRLIERIIKNDLSPPPTMNIGQLLHPVSLLSSSEDINEFSSLLISIPTPIGPPKKKEDKKSIDLDMLHSMVQSLGGWNEARKEVESHQSRSSSPSSMTSSDSVRSSSSSSLNSSDSSDCDDSTDIRALFLSSVASRIAADPKSKEWREKVKQSEKEEREKKRIAAEKNRKKMKISPSVSSKKSESDEEKEHRMIMQEKMKKWERKREQERMEKQFRKNQEEIERKKEEERRLLQEKIRSSREAKKAKQMERKRKNIQKAQPIPSSSCSSSSDESSNSQLSIVHETVKKEEPNTSNVEDIRPLPFTPIVLSLIPALFFIVALFFVM